MDTSNSQLNWENEKSHMLLNPMWPDVVIQKMRSAQKPNLPSHLWLATSGTTNPNELKLIALSKKSFLVSAKAVNEHINASQKDIWLNVLPIFHVGGLSIYARSFLSGSKIIDFNKKWNVTLFLKTVEEQKVSLTSLVPTQVYDLVRGNKVAPKSLRAVFVGGGALSFNLYRQARALGWPLLPTYGMTEACSQVATAPLESLNTVNEDYQLQILKHINLTTNSEHCAVIKGESLFSGRLVINKDGSHWQRHEDQPFETRDIVEVKDGYIKVLGRKDNTKKILGELVSLDELNSIFERIGIKDQAVFLFVEHERKQNEIVLVAEISLLQNKKDLIEADLKKIPPYCKPQAIYWVHFLPKTELGKIKLGQLKSYLNFKKNLFDS